MSLFKVNFCLVAFCSGTACRDVGTPEMDEGGFVAGNSGGVAGDFGELCNRSGLAGLYAILGVVESRG